MSALTCPKCQADMRQYERNGVHVDQCTGCRGVFLDRGELEHLVDAELRWANQAPPAAPPAAAPPPAQYPPQQQGYGNQGYANQGYGSQGYGKPPKKRKSFLEELFD
jgi:Zn-finger nucleic acid-binding protein